MKKKQLREKNAYLQPLKNKIFLTLKLTAFMAFMLNLNISALVYSKTERINLNIKEKSIREILKTIEGQSEFRFFYNDEFADLDRVVSVDLKDKSIQEVLSTLLAKANVTYKVMDNNFVVITPAKVLQIHTITGMVTDASNGEPLPGVNVVIKGTTVGAITDLDGKFTLNVNTDDVVLVFSFVGYTPVELSGKGQSLLNVSLQQDVKQLNEVVVTALGIKRDKKALSYSSQQISEDEIAKGKDLNFINSLSGKTAGLELKTSGSGAGGSTKIVLRGNKTVTGNSQPLYVIDGIPMANYQSSNAEGFWGGHDSGDGLSSLNPDDIESMTILKGANAAALYGSQGANGVILVTTKKGKKGLTKVTLSSSTSLESVSELPEFQYRYGQTSSGSVDSWGSSGTYKDYVKDFFNTGLSSMNSISMSGGNDITTAYFSYANSYDKGIIPTNTFDKNNLTFKQSSKFFKDKLTVTSNIMLSDQNTHNRAMNGYYFNPLTGLYLAPRGIDLDDYKKKYQVYDESRNIMTQNWFVYDLDTQQNPWWILNKNANDDNTKRLIGNLEMSLSLTKNLSIKARGNYDYTKQIYEQKIYAGTCSVLSSDNGRWIYSNLVSHQTYGDLLVQYDKDFSNFDVHAVAGASYEDKVLGDGVTVDTGADDGLVVANEFYFNNMVLNSATSVMADRRRKNSVFANATIGYKGKGYLDLSGRNDWSSTLAGTGNGSYFYPSVGLTLLPSEIFELPAAINFAKVRVSYSMVGQEVPFNMVNPGNSVSRDGLTMNTEMPFSSLKPESQKNLEFGAEMRFLDNRIGLEATYYKIDNTNQFLALDAPSSSGYSTYYVNAGHIRNSGFEFSLSTEPVKMDNFSWKSDVNYSMNRNKILALHPDLQGKYTLSGGGEGYNMYIVEGGSFGDIYVNAYDRDENGNILLDDSYIPTKASTMKKVGSANPDFQLGWNNSLDYKDFSLSFLIDAKLGGKFVSMTEAMYDMYGVSKRTADARDAGGVKVVGVLSDGTAVNTTVDAKEYYTGTSGRDGIMEPYVYDATTVRMRQIVLAYNWDLQKKNIFIKRCSVSVIGKNLFFFYKKAPYDPDITISTGNGTQNVENFGLPSTRTYGFNVSVNF